MNFIKKFWPWLALAGVGLYFAVTKFNAKKQQQRVLQRPPTMTSYHPPTRRTPAGSVTGQPVIK